MQRFETKYDLLKQAYNDERLSKGTITLFQYLVHKSNKEMCFSAVETIAEALSCCKRTVQYNMRKLEKAGYIIRKDRWYQHQQLTNQYVFNLGVKEDKQGKYQYSDEELEQIDSFLFNNQDKESQGKEIHKADEIIKIYNMSLPSREKLLLVYLVHKVNKKGCAYVKPEEIKQALGVSLRTLMKLINRLRIKNLIRVKLVSVSGKELLVFKVTGNVLSVEEYQDVIQKEEVQMPLMIAEEIMKFVQNTNDSNHDHIQEKYNSIQVAQNKIRKKRSTKMGCKNWVQKLKSWKDKIISLFCHVIKM